VRDKWLAMEEDDDFGEPVDQWGNPWEEEEPVD
jgi:hypothetical protein